MGVFCFNFFFEPGIDISLLDRWDFREGSVGFYYFCHENIYSFFVRGGGLTKQEPHQPRNGTNLFFFFGITHG